MKLLRPTLLIILLSMTSIVVSAQVDSLAISQSAEASEPQTIPNNEIWYTASRKIEPRTKNGFGAQYVSNEWDATTNKGVIAFAGDVQSVGAQAFHIVLRLLSVELSPIVVV